MTRSAESSIYSSVVAIGWIMAKVDNSLTSFCAKQEDNFFLIR